MHPLQLLRHHVTGAIERGEGPPVTEVRRIEGFNVRIVHKGESYGRNNCLTHDQDDPLVEFYDARWQGRIPDWPLGQFVSRYYLSTLLQGSHDRGLLLDASSPSWSVSPHGMRQVLDFIRS